MMAYDFPCIYENLRETLTLAKPLAGGAFESFESRPLPKKGPARAVSRSLSFHPFKVVFLCGMSVLSYQIISLCSVFQNVWNLEKLQTSAILDR